MKRRGQRYINIRDWDKAIEDLTQAGIHHNFIKAKNLKYTDNLNWAIWYYLGICYYFRAEFEMALDVFQKSYEHSADNVSLLASINWVYNCYRRLGRDKEAQKIVAPIQEGMGYSGNYYKCILVYNKFKSAISQEVTQQQLIPLDVSSSLKEKKSDDNTEAKAIYDYEPDEETILKDLLPKNVSIQIFKVLLESDAGEQGARMAAMDNATRNAGEMIDSLTLKYNRTRQAFITKELIEIISGAESI